MTTASALEAAPAAPPPTSATRPFSAFEWMVAFRYLRARRAHGSVSVIAGFSFAGIVLGVMALIVVMSVMNGFRHDLMDKMIGLNGHMFLQGVETPLTDYEAVTERVGKVPGVTLALPLVDATGVGDAFNGGFLHAFLHGSGWDDCLRAGNICGSMSGTRPGGSEGLPAPQEYKRQLLKMRQG